MKNALLYLFAFLLSIQILAQGPPQLYPDDEIIIIFDPSANQTEIDLVLDYLNMHVIDGPTPHTVAMLLKLNPSGAPGWAGYNPIDSINGVVVGASSKSKVNGAGLNNSALSTSWSSALFSSPPECYNILDPNTQPNGGYPVNTAIFDTGITAVSSVYGNFFDPTNLGYNYIDPNIFPIDDNDHGTHISSIVMENLENTNAMIELSAYKTHESYGTGQLFDVIKAVDEAISQNVQVINMSFSYYAPHTHKGDPGAPLRIAIDKAKSAGILCVASAGNHNIDNDDDSILSLSAFPASYPNDNIIAVASASCSHIKSSWSNYGVQSVDVMAPGENIWGYDKDGYPIAISGTSQATAFVSKLATYLASFQNQFDWELTKCAILSGVIPLTGPAYVLSDGYINSAMSLTELQSTPPCSFSPPDAYMIDKDVSKKIKGIRLINSTDVPSFEIATDDYQLAEVVVVNVLGEIVYKNVIELQKGIANYDFDFASDDFLGVYFLSIKGVGEVETLKFVR